MTQLQGTAAAAAVTGAASGIGRELALQLAARGCDLALADRDTRGLEALAAELGAQSKVKVTVTPLDVADQVAVARFAEAAIKAHPKLNVLINNAGVALMGDHDEIPMADFEWLMAINFWGVVYGCRAFLPHFSRQSEAHIVSLSSVFGLIGPPGQTAYAASKFAVRGYAEALRHECNERGGRIRISTVHPGGVNTNIVRNARAVQSLSNKRVEIEDGFAKIARTSPAEAAARIIAGIERNEPRILIGADARLIDRLQRLMPASNYKWIKRISQRATGRTTRLGAKDAG